MLVPQLRISFSVLQLATCGSVVVCFLDESLAMTLRNCRDILAELASIGHLPLPTDGTPTSSQPFTLYPRYDGRLPSVKDASHMSPGLYQSVGRHQPSFTGGAGGDSGTSPMELSPFAPKPTSETWFPPDDPYAEMSTDPAQASRELGEMMSLIDSDTISMWTNTPLGVECVSLAFLVLDGR
jgi:hypothetical protein